MHYSQPPANLPDAPEVRADVAAFKASARSLDHGVGMVLNALETAGLAEDTLVIFTTDHGMPFPGAKATLYDRGLGVMLILRGPEPFHGGRVHRRRWCRTSTSTRRSATSSASSGPPFLQGVSLMPLLRGDGRTVREEIFAGSTWHAAYEPQRAIRTDALQVHPPLGGPAPPVLPNTDDGPSKELLLRNGWADSEIPPEQLFDLVHDPNEAHNLVGDPAHAARARRAARPAGGMDARDRRPAARRPRRPAAGGGASTRPTSARRPTRRRGSAEAQASSSRSSRIAASRCAGSAAKPASRPSSLAR